MMREKLDLICMKKLNITLSKDPELTRWKEFIDKLKYPKSQVTIGLIGNISSCRMLTNPSWKLSCMQAPSTNARYR
jgi:CTP synthase (UTP-ammonia lyase)